MNPVQLLQEVQMALSGVHGRAESLSRLIPHQVCHLRAANQDMMDMQEVLTVFSLGRLSIKPALANMRMQLYRACLLLKSCDHPQVKDEQSQRNKVTDV